MTLNRDAIRSPIFWMIVILVLLNLVLIGFANEKLFVGNCIISRFMLSQTLGGLIAALFACYFYTLYRNKVITFIFIAFSIVIFGFVILSTLR